MKKKMNSKKKLTNGKNEINSSMKLPNQDSVSDIQIKLKQYASELLQKYHDDGMYYPMAFFHGLSDTFGREGWSNSPNSKLFRSMIDCYNSFISQHEIMGVEVEHIEKPLPLLYEDFSLENVLGSYPVSLEDGVPQLMLRVPDTYQVFADQIITCGLLDYIYELIDIRKLEASIPELKGLNDYLKKLAPHAYHAYCKLGEQVKYNATLDIDGYTDYLRQIKMDSWSNLN
jgi:hypothetical protein